MTPLAARTFLLDRASALGFDAVGIAPAGAIPEAGERLARWLEAGHHGDMDWLADRPERRASPRGLWPQVRSVILLGTSYAPDADPMADLVRRDRGVVSVYARRRDYHDVIKGRLKELAGALAAKAGADVKVFVDTAPVLERALAEASGLGWQGKSTMLISRRHGAWLFLGAIYTTLDIVPDDRHANRCGSCTACLDACPTQAFPMPYVLDARRCLAYLGIEYKGVIPREFRAAFGNRVFGCDDCLSVCPWNSFAVAARDSRLQARDALAAPDLATLAALDDAGFRAMFAGTPVKRTGRDRFLRNVMIAIGNSDDARLAASARARLDDESPLVRGMAVWALSRLLAHGEMLALKQTHAARETDPAVRAEWDEIGGLS